jgi:hypothetical protein
MATVDFDPGDEGMVFQVAADLVIHGWHHRSSISQSDMATFQTAFGTGVREELAALGAGTTLAVTVVLRSMRVHELDSHAKAFQAVGHLTVRNALALAYGRPGGPSAAAHDHLLQWPSVPPGEEQLPFLR